MGCEQWFSPPHPLTRYCSKACAAAARVWSRRQRVKIDILKDTSGIRRQRMEMQKAKRQPERRFTRKARGGAVIGLGKQRPGQHSVPTTSWSSASPARNSPSLKLYYDAPCPFPIAKPNLRDVAVSRVKPPDIGLLAGCPSALLLVYGTPLGDVPFLMLERFQCLFKGDFLRQKVRPFIQLVDIMATWKPRCIATTQCTGGHREQQPFGMPVHKATSVTVHGDYLRFRGEGRENGAVPFWRQGDKHFLCDCSIRNAACIGTGTRATGGSPVSRS